MGVLSIMLFFSDKFYSLINKQEEITYPETVSLYEEKIKLMHKELDSFKKGTASLLNTLDIVSRLITSKQMAIDYITKENPSSYLSSLLAKEGDRIDLGRLQRIITILNYRVKAEGFVRKYIDILLNESMAVSSNFLNEPSDEVRKERIVHILEESGFSKDKINNALEVAASENKIQALLEALVFRIFGSHEIEAYLKIYDSIFTALRVMEEEDQHKRELLMATIDDKWVKERVRRIVSVNIALNMEGESSIKLGYVDSCAELDGSDVYNEKLSVLNRLYSAACNYGMVTKAKYERKIKSINDCMVFSVISGRYDCFDEFEFNEFVFARDLVLESASVTEEESYYWLDMLSSGQLSDTQSWRLISILLSEKVNLDKGDEAFEYFACREMKGRELSADGISEFQERFDVQCTYRKQDMALTSK